MKTTTTFALLFLSAALLTADIVHRAATAQEKAALEKALAAITKVIDTFGNPDWTIVSQFHPKIDSVAAEPPSPLEAAMSYSRKYGIKEGSPLFKAKVMPAIAAIRKAMDAKDYAGATKAGEATNGTMDFTVETYVNRISVPSGAKAKNIEVHGAPMAYETLDPYRGGAWVVVVGVGDWAHAKPTKTAVEYRFANAKKTPHVENIVFEFVTKRPNGFAAERIREIVRTTDWSVLDRGLSR